MIKLMVLYLPPSRITKRRISESNSDSDGSADAIPLRHSVLPAPPRLKCIPALRQDAVINKPQREAPSTLMATADLTDTQETTEARSLSPSPSPRATLTNHSDGKFYFFFLAPGILKNFL